MPRKPLAKLYTDQLKRLDRVAGDLNVVLLMLDAVDGITDQDQHIGGYVNDAGKSVATSYGALSLYLDFINLFQFLLALFGNRR